MDAPRRGRLHVYAGMCVGAGTTHRMLEEGLRLRATGADVVVAILGSEPGPAIERLAEGLDSLPPASVSYRGVTIEALDTEAVVARRPEVALVDELWREHPPGVRPASRWQSVQALRDAGADVVATLDLGHLESLADAVQTITGIAVRERLPDAVLDGADEVELVDVGPATLRQRIADGLVVGSDRATVLLDRAYTTANLEALRRLALRCLVNRVERDLSFADGPPARSAGGAVMVLADGGPGGRDAIRRAASLSTALHRRLVAVAAERASSAAWADSASTADDLALARDLGAAVVATDEHDPVDAILDAARRTRASHVVLPIRGSSLSDRLRGRSAVERLTADRSLELHLVPGQDVEP
jgi:two-component system sensor histidine kinase KdpD